MFAKLFKAEEDLLLTLWLADQVNDLVKNEKNANNALRVAENQFKFDTQLNDR